MGGGMREGNAGRSIPAPRGLVQPFRLADWARGPPKSGDEADRQGAQARTRNERCAGSVAGVPQLRAEGGEGRGDLVREIGPVGFDGEAAVVVGAAQGAEEAAEVVAVDAGRGAVLIFRDVHVADQRGDLENVVGGLAVAQHVENVDEELDAAGVGAADGFGAFEDGVDAVALAAVEGLNEERDALFFGERADLAEDVDELLERGGGGESGSGSASENNAGSQ